MDRSNNRAETRSHLNVSIHTYQHQTHLHKITVTSGTTLQADFSQGIAKFDTLPNHYLLLILAEFKIMVYHRSFSDPLQYMTEQSPI